MNSPEELYLWVMSTRVIPTLEITRYLVPLREGGSLPAIVEGEDGLLYVCKFRGAGQGKKALIAEWIGGEMARYIGLKVPEIVLMNLDESFSRTEADEEIQDLLRFSTGLNLGMTFLSTAITYDPLVPVGSTLEASKVVLLDSLITNIDRTVKNTNLLNWHEELWLIDHGASLYFHHTLKNWEAHAQRSFPPVKDHVLLDRADQLEEAREAIEESLSPEALESLISSIPDDWLKEETDAFSKEERRDIYRQYMATRLSQLSTLTQEAQDARQAHI